MIHITWAAPQYLMVLLLVIAAFILLGYRLRMVRKTVALMAGKWSALVVQHFSTPRQIAKAVLMGIGIFFLWLALLRPQWNKKEEMIAQEGRDVLIALDISRSMLATDCKPNRLECAKTKIKRLLNLLDCERVGLILFSGSAFMQCPLTTDYSAFLMYLDHVDAETISSGTTALDAALKLALETYEELPSKKSKSLMIFTDGEDFSHNLKQYKMKAKEQGLYLFTIGVGTSEGAPIPLYDEQGAQVGHQKDSKGNVVITRLDESVIGALAQESGGLYVPITKNNSDLKKLVTQIQRFEKEKFEDKKVSQLEEKYHYFLIVSFVCFVLEWLL